MKNKLTTLTLVLILITGCKTKENKLEEISQYPQVMCAPVLTDKEWYKSDNTAPIIEGLDVLHFPISTKNELAQKYFNQGLVLAYGFNHAEAARFFCNKTYHF